MCSQCSSQTLWPLNLRKVRLTIPRHKASVTFRLCYVRHHTKKKNNYTFYTIQKRFWGRIPSQNRKKRGDKNNCISKTAGNQENSTREHQPGHHNSKSNTTEQCRTEHNHSSTSSSFPRDPSIKQPKWVGWSPPTWVEIEMSICRLVSRHANN